MTLKHSFGAVARPDARVLILGSLPGDRSLAAQEYYAHPGNRFWELVGAAIDSDLRALPYAARLDRLADAGIGLWDVIASGHRPGSLDAAIRDATVNDLAGLRATLPDLRAVAFNGRTAASIAAREGIDFGSLARVALPSSSGAHARMSFAAKCDHWLALRDWLWVDAASAGG